MGEVGDVGTVLLLLLLVMMVPVLGGLPPAELLICARFDKSRVED